MTETLFRREESMRNVLRKLQANTPFENLSFEERRTAKECFDLGFFEGLFLEEMASGRIIAEYQFGARITYKGMQFLEPEPAKVEVSMSAEEHALAEEAKRQERAAAAEQESHAAQKEAVRLQERSEDKADEERRHKTQNRTTLLAALISGTSGLLLGMLIEHFSKVIDIVLSLGQ
jgi:F0F1-type ATP synthase assembly protein I